MNAGLKAIIAVGFSTAKLVMDLVEKKGTATAIADLQVIATGVPAVVTNISDLTIELTALKTAANEEDLITYVLSQFATISTDVKTTAIVQAAVQLASGIAINTYALVEAIKS